MEQENLITKQKHQGVKITIAIILILGLMVGAYFLYQYKFNNPKNIINNYLESAKTNLKNTLKSDIGNNVYKIDGNIKFDANIPVDTQETLDVLKNLLFTFDGEIDMANSKGNISFNTKYKNDNVLNLKSYYEKNVVYLLLDGIFDKYIKEDISVQNANEEINIPAVKIDPNDLQIIYSSMIDALKKEINDLEFKKENETITIDGKEIKVINNYVELHNKEINEFLVGIFNNLENDSKFTETLKKLSDIDIKTSFDEIVSSFNSENLNGTYKISFYTDRNILKKNLVSVRQLITIQGIPISFNIDKISDEEMNIEMSSMGIIYSIKVKKTSSNINTTITMNALGQYIKAEFNMHYEKIKEVTKPDLSNSVNADDLTEKQKEEIRKKILDNKYLSKLIEGMNDNNLSISIDA